MELIFYQYECPLHTMASALNNKAISWGRWDLKEDKEFQTKSTFPEVYPGTLILGEIHRWVEKEKE